MKSLANLRIDLETALAGRVPSPFTHRTEKIIETVSTGIPEVDFLTGGLPRGSLTEICGPAGSGHTSMLLAALAARTEKLEACALIDGRDAFDPLSAEAAGVNLKNLLWVRCRNINQSLRATDLLLRSGGFGLIALDLSDIPPQTVRYVPLNAWFRFQKTVEDTPTILLLLDQESNAKTCASLVLSLGMNSAGWSAPPEVAQPQSQPNSLARLLNGCRVHAKVLRSRITPITAISSHPSFVPRAAMHSQETFRSYSETGFEVRTMWSYSGSMTSSPADPKLK